MRDRTLPDGVEIRPARESDLPDLQETFARSHAVAYEGVLDDEELAEATSDPGSFYPADRFERKLAEDTRRYLVATVEGTVRATASFVWGAGTTHEFVPEGDGQVRGMYAHPDHWGRGIGTALIERGFAAFPDDVETVWVECLAENDVGSSFYESVGFEPVDRRTIEYMEGEHPTRIYRREP